MSRDSLAPCSFPGFHFRAPSHPTRNALGFAGAGRAKLPRCLWLETLLPNCRRERTRTPTPEAATASAELGDLGTGFSPRLPEGTLGLRLENNRKEKWPKVLSLLKALISRAQFAMVCKHPVSLHFIDRKSTPKLVTNSGDGDSGGCSDAAFVFYPTLSSPQSTLCMHRRAMHVFLKEKVANYAERLLLTTSPRELGSSPG